ncbi:FixH family protein [Pseudenhygromyxa sp. WMMC2535]|uniref:FixH family protein n=1 Tax=Pseudenhygromyxa sp. WMMC2535 TaxID=2712867 RepID=UPI00155663EE|nr:FixH family protein [Pseudenhygromyxa sp. WMMC2535]NVB41401.1 FixH family protein [Pseudenhygromyxa sp. WMMC2535]
MSRFKPLALALALLAPLTACDGADVQDDVETRAVEDFSDGMSAASDMGLFRVTLWSDSGSLEVGRNDLVLRVGFDNPNDPSPRGNAIPSARVDLDAWMPAADLAMSAEPTVSYLGDGQYRLENVRLDAPGVWNFDFEIAVGENVRESVSLAFEIVD